MSPLKPAPAPHAFAPAAAHLAFRFRSGHEARSLDEFARILGEASPDTIAYHRDHFAPWVRHVVGDDPLARRIESFAEDAPEADSLREILVTLVRARLDQLRSAR